MSIIGGSIIGGGSGGGVGIQVGAASGDTTGALDQARIEAAITSAGVGGKVVFKPGETYVVFGGLAALSGQTWEMWGATIKRMGQIRTTLVTDDAVGQDIILPSGKVAADGWLVGMYCTIYDNTNTASTDYSSRKHKITAIDSGTDTLTVSESFTTSKADMVTAGGGSYSVASVGDTIDMTNTNGVGDFNDITFLGGIIDGNKDYNTYLNKWDINSEFYLNKGYTNFQSYGLTVKNASADAIVYGGSGTRFINPRCENSNGHGLHAAGVGVTSFTGTNSGTSSTVMTDSSKSWIVNQFVGGTLNNTTDSTTGTIISNTATTITSDIAWSPDEGYEVIDINGEGAVITNAVLIDSKQAYTGGGASGDVTGHGEGAISYSQNTKNIIYENLQIEGSLYGGIGGLSSGNNSNTQFFNGFVRNITGGTMIQMSTQEASNVIFDGMQFDGQHVSGDDGGSLIGFGSNTSTVNSTIRMTNCITKGCYCTMKDVDDVILEGNSWYWNGNTTTTLMQIRNDCNNIYVNDRLETTKRLAVGILENASNITIEGEIIDFGRVAIHDNSTGTGNIYAPRRISQGASLETTSSTTLPIHIDGQTNRVIIRDIHFDFSTLQLTNALITIVTADDSVVTGCTMLHTLGGTGDAVDIQTNAARVKVINNFLDDTVPLTAVDSSSGTTGTITPNYTI